MSLKHKLIGFRHRTTGETTAVVIGVIYGLILFFIMYNS